MKNIKESLSEIQDITPYLRESQVNEGLKDVWQTVKSKFKQVYNYLKGLVVKLGSYILPVSNTGLLIPAITPLTAGQAYADGKINKKSTFVKMDKAGAQITGCKTKLDDALKLYGGGNSISYWQTLIKESQEDKSEYYSVLENYAADFAQRHPEVVNEAKLHTEDPQAKYNIIEDDDELKARIAMCLNNPKLARLLIWGAPGIGKTAILLNIIGEMKSEFPDYRLIVKTLSNETPDNLTLPDYVEDMQDEDFAELAKKLDREESAIRKLYKFIGGRKAIDVPKTWLPVYKPTGDKEVDEYLNKKCGNGLLFIDELSRAKQDVLNVMLPLINEGAFNGYVLGSGWTIICASNRMQDESRGQEKLGNALVNRFLQVHYEPTVKTWRKWADKQNFISPLILQWLSMADDENYSGGKFYYWDPNDDQNALADSTLICTPRAWTNACRLLACYSHTGKLEGFDLLDIPDNIIKSALNEAIPAAAVDVFMDFLKVVRSVGNFDHVVHEVWQNGGKGVKIDKKNLMKISLPLAQLICSAHSGTLPSAKEFENICTWLVDQNSDQLASYFLDVFQNVFVSDADPTMRAQLFYLQIRLQRAGGDLSKVDGVNEEFVKFFSKWGLTYETTPDYSAGMIKLVGKYKDSFKSAVIGAHTSAMG